MTPQRRCQWANYIADGFRYAAKEAGKPWPDGTIIVAQTYSELAALDSIIGTTIFITNTPSSADFSLAFIAIHEDHNALLTAFREYQELYRSPE